MFWHEIRRNHTFFLWPYLISLSFQQERDVERSARHELEREIEILKERLQGSQRAMDAIRSELSMRDSRISELERDIRTNVHSVHTHSTQLTMFREQLANLLSDYDGSYGSEDDIRRKIENIVLMNRDFRGVSLRTSVLRKFTHKVLPKICHRM